MNDPRYATSMGVIIRLTAFIPLLFGIASVIVLWRDKIFLLSFIPAFAFSWIPAHILLAVRRLFEFFHESVLIERISVPQDRLPIVGSLITLSLLRSSISIITLAILPLVITHVLPEYADLKPSQVSGLVLIWGATFGLSLMVYTQRITDFQLEEMAPLYVLALSHAVLIIVFSTNATLVTVIGLIMVGVLVVASNFAEYSSFILRQLRGPIPSHWD